MPAEPLDLSGADTSAAVVPSGRYIVRVNNVEWRKTGGGGKLPEGTPMLNVDFVILSSVDGNEQYAGRHVFTNYMMPKSGDAEEDKVARMLGIFTRFLVAATGEDESKITSGKYKLDADDLIGKEMQASVGVRAETEQYDAQNTVKGVKPLGEAAGVSTGLL